MKNKYLNGLLAGVLTAGAVQGSGNEGKMPEMGEKQTPVVQQQGMGNPMLQQMARFLAENAYRNGDVDSAEVILNSVGLNGLEIITEWGNIAVPALPTQITSMDTFDLSGNNGAQSNEGASRLPEMSLSKPEIPSAPAELTQLTIGKNGEIKEEASGKKSQAAKQTKLDPYSMQVVTKYFETADDLHNAMMVNSKFEKLADRNRINHVPVTKANKALFDYIETQQIFGPNDYIKPGMCQYIITYPVTKAEIETWVKELQDKHTGKALKDEKKPIVFEYQLLPRLWNKTAYELQNEIVEEGDDFIIKQYYTDSNTDAWCFEAKNYRLPRLNCFKKPIVFEKVENICIEDEFDLFVKKGNHTGFDPEKHIIKEYEIAIRQHGITSTYSKYHDFIQRYPVIQYPEVAKVSFSKVDIDGKEINEQQRQFKILSKDKKVQTISIGYQKELNKSPELLGSIKIDCCFGSKIDLQRLGKFRIFTFSSPYGVVIPVGVKIYTFQGFQRNNDDVSEKVREYVQYVKDNNLEYLSGFVNFANKPSYLTDEEWRKVIVLTGMVEELMDLVDQKFNEYEANPNAAPANDPYGCGNNYGCGGYGCGAGYNPYGQYYYGGGYGC